MDLTVNEDRQFSYKIVGCVREKGSDKKLPFYKVFNKTTGLPVSYSKFHQKEEDPKQAEIGLTLRTLSLS